MIFFIKSMSKWITWGKDNKEVKEFSKTDETTPVWIYQQEHVANKDGSWL